MRQQRLHGLDWLRAGAIILVVALHAGIAYLVAPMPGLIWSTQDATGSVTVDAIAWWIDGFIMPLFFVLSGFVAVGLMRRHGPGRFARHRTLRLLLPLALGCVFILPLDLYVWLLGWAAEGKIALRKLQSLKLDGPLADGIWGTSHLWFLQYLWLYCMSAAAICWFIERRRKDHLISNDQSSGDHYRRPVHYSVLRTRYADDLIMALLGVSIAALWWDPQLVIGFRHSWWPLPANLLFYAPWFAIGWLLAARQPRRKIQRGEWRLVASFAVFAILLPLIHRHIETPRVGQARLVLAALFVTHAWLAVSGWIGVCVRWLDREPHAIVKYVAAASFWVYLFHHPVVGLTQIALRTVQMPVFAKFGVTLGLGIGLSLLTYEVLVRRTWIGQVLNGRRDLTPQAPVPTQPPLLLPEVVEPTRREAA